MVECETNVLALECTESALRKSLAEGRTYIAFDWIADPTGTAFVPQSGDKTYTIGDTIPHHSPTMIFRAEVPLPATLRLMGNGTEVARAEGRILNYEVKEPGVYRLEAAPPGR